MTDTTRTDLHPVVAGLFDALEAVADPGSTRRSGRSISIRFDPPKPDRPRFDPVEFRRALDHFRQIDG